MANSGIEKIAVSVYKNDDANERQIDEYTGKVKKFIDKNLGKNVKVIFFDSQSPGCWINPPSAPDK